MARLGRRHPQDQGHRPGEREERCRDEHQQDVLDHVEREQRRVVVLDPRHQRDGEGHHRADERDRPADRDGVVRMRGVHAPDCPAPPEQRDDDAEGRERLEAPAEEERGRRRRLGRSQPVSDRRPGRDQPAGDRPAGHDDPREDRSRAHRRHRRMNGRPVRSADRAVRPPWPIVAGGAGRDRRRASNGPARRRTTGRRGGYHGRGPRWARTRPTPHSARRRFPAPSAPVEDTGCRAPLARAAPVTG